MQELPKVKGPYYTCEAVLTESYHMLVRPNLRARLIDFVAEAPVGQMDVQQSSWHRRACDVFERKECVPVTEFP